MSIKRTPATVVAAFLVLNVVITIFFMGVYILAGSEAFVQKARQLLNVQQPQVATQPQLLTAEILIHPKVHNFDPAQAIITFVSHEASPSAIEVEMVSLTTNQTFQASEIKLLRLDTQEIFIPEFSQADTTQTITFTLNQTFLPTTQLVVQTTGKPLEIAEIDVILDPTQTTSVLKATIIIDDLYNQFPAHVSCADISKQFPQLKYATDNLILAPGRHTFEKTIIVPKNCPVHISSGAILQFAPNTSFISYSPITAHGTQTQPIIFTAQDPQQGWGVLGIVSTKQAVSAFSFVTLEYSHPVTINGILFTGGLAAHTSDVTIDQSTFRYNHGDDAVNIKSATLAVTNSIFVNNEFDAIDVDIGHGAITNNRFITNGNDGIDLSFSDLTISHNHIEGAGDKCISVGERSKPILQDMTLVSCVTGIAVKDGSAATIENVTIRDSTVAIALSQKKQIFTGGKATLKQVKLENNQQDFNIDALSTLQTVD